MAFDLLRSAFRSMAGAPRRQPARRRCILHVGSPKTATSSIQSMLKTDAKRFLRHGILVPKSGQRSTGAHRDLVHDLAGVPENPTQGVEQTFIREVSDSGAHTVLISSETLWPLLAVPAQAERLIGCLKSLAFDIELVVYVRNQPQYVNSSYAQNVKTWFMGDEFPVFARRALTQAGKYCNCHWISFAERHTVGLSARPFSEEIRKLGVPRDFLATIGLASAKGFGSAIERNVTPGPFAVEIARTLVRRFGSAKSLTRHQADRCRSALRSELATLPIEEGAYCGLTTSFAAEVEQRFADDNARFAKFAWGRPWQDVFASDVGRSFEPNDYAMMGVPGDRRELLAQVLASLEPKIAAIRRAV